MPEALATPATPAPTSPAAGNTTESRTADGTLLDQTQPLASQTETPSSETAPAPSEPKAPTDYTAFTLPEGTTVDAGALEQAQAVFKELGLTQTQAQRLLDFQVGRDKASGEANTKAVESMRAEWRDQVSKDPQLGSNLEAVKAEIGRAYTHLDPALVTDFRKAMDLTGAGDNPAFIKAFYNMAKMINEGGHVSGGSPSPNGQTRPGTDVRPSAAKAMYPNLSQ